MSRINETLKQKIDELDLDKRLNDLTEQAEVAINRALDSASDYARDHRTDLERWLDRASETVEQRTGGRYSDRVTRVRDTLAEGVDRLAARRGDSDV